MTQEENRATLSKEPKTQEELEEQEEMLRAGLNNPQSPCGRPEDRFGK